MDARLRTARLTVRFTAPEIARVTRRGASELTLYCVGIATQVRFA